MAHQFIVGDHSVVRMIRADYSRYYVVNDVPIHQHRGDCDRLSTQVNAPEDGCDYWLRGLG